MLQHVAQAKKKKTFHLVIDKFDSGIELYLMCVDSKRNLVSHLFSKIKSAFIDVLIIL